MCTETFLRLPEEKRTRFLNAAWEEFTSARFTDVSVNNIVHRAGIPRGSFYQYFTDKNDLFVYLLEDVRNHVRESYRQVLKDNGGDIFQAQLDCFDRLTSQDLTLDPVLTRCAKFLHNNRGVDIHKLPCPGKRALDGLWDVMDLSRFRQPDREYGWIVISLLAAAFGSAFMDTMLCPEDREFCREGLVKKLEIIKYGCLPAGFHN